VTERLPIFPLGTVLFPGLVLPLNVFEPRYRSLVRHLMDLPAGQPREFGVVAIQRGWEVEVSGPGGVTASSSLTLFEVGCTAEVRQVTEQPDGRFDLVTVGRRRFRVKSVAADQAPYLIAGVDWLAEPDGDPGVAEDLAGPVLEIFQRYLALIRRESSDLGEQLPDRPDVLSYLVAASAALSLEDRQRLLATESTAGRLRLERTLLRREVTLLSQLRAVPATLADLSQPGSPN
jgi:Lon protease-like protein